MIEQNKQTLQTLKFQVFERSVLMVERRGIEPLASRLRSECCLLKFQYFEAVYHTLYHRTIY